MKVLDYKDHDFKKDNYNNSIVLFEIPDDTDTCELFNYNGDIWNINCLNPINKLAFAEKVTLKAPTEIDDISNTDDFECPYCGSKHSDSWECDGDSFEHECETCGGIYECNKEISVDYNTTPINRDVEVSEVLS